MHDISLQPKNKSAGGIRADIPLELAGTVKTYRYLDEEEAAEQEKATAGKGGR
jgi:type IV pilus assembly protein PilO